MRRPSEAAALERIDHAGVARHDLDVKIAFCGSVFELTVTSREVNHEQGLHEAVLRIARLGAAPGHAYLAPLSPHGAPASWLPAPCLP